jgi:hypothetical protein
MTGLVGKLSCVSKNSSNTAFGSVLFISSAKSKDFSFAITDMFQRFFYHVFKSLFQASLYQVSFSSLSPSECIGFTTTTNTTTKLLLLLLLLTTTTTC